MNKEARKHRNAILLVAAAAALITGILYIPALNNGFVNWDDPEHVLNNIETTSLSPGFIKWAFTTLRFGVYLPLPLISYALDYALWGMNPFGFHLTNILIHVANTFLVVMLVGRLFDFAGEPGSDRLFMRKVLISAGVTGLLFGTHPLHVESVAWVSERKDVLCAFFALLSLLAYLRYVLGGRRKLLFYWVTLLVFALSLLSKPMAVTIPVVFLILDVYPLGRLSLSGGSAAAMRILSEKVPFLALSLVFSLIAVIAQQSYRAVALISNFSLFERMLTAARAAVFYLLKFFYPSDLVPFYPIFTPVTFLAKDAGILLLLSGVTIFCLLSWRRSRIWMTVWAYYLVTLIPVSGIIQVGGQAAADRYTYLPLLGLMALIGLGIATLAAKMLAGTLLRERALVVGIILLLGLLAGMFCLTTQQMKIWKDSLSLWNRELTAYPSNVPMVYRARADAYYRAGDFGKAIADYTSAIQLDPGDYQSYSARGMVFLMSGLYDVALADFDRALSVRSDYGEALYYRSLALRQMGKTDVSR